MYLFHNCCSRAILQNAIQLDISSEGIDKLIIVFYGHIRIVIDYTGLLVKPFDIDSNTEIF